MLLSISGLDFLTAISGAASVISNVGPVLWHDRSEWNYKAIPDLSKWILSVGMLLEGGTFAVLVLFFPSFWETNKVNYEIYKKTDTIRNFLSLLW